LSNTSLSGRTALVTGSSRNLGSEFAKGLARRGARVVITHKNSADDANLLLEKLFNLNGLNNIAVHGDLSEISSAEELVSKALDEVQSIDILVNNLGPFIIKPFVELSSTEFQYYWNTNVGAAFACSKAVAPSMRSKHWGRIINVSAGSAFIRNHSIYSLAKSALITLTESLAVELGPAITVNAIAPGQIFESADEMSSFDPKFNETALAQTPLGRFPTRREVSDIAIGFCESSFDIVTGVTIPIDGGWRLRSS
jgi:NAD(P)-dependent dehydrogenase (short-subunit alcohol dehydrogenase family)